MKTSRIVCLISDYNARDYLDYEHGTYIAGYDEGYYYEYDDGYYDDGYEDVEDAEWKEAYLEYISRFRNEIVGAGLMYLDTDNVPELIFERQGIAGGARLSILSYQKGTVYEMTAGDASYLTMSYSGFVFKHFIGQDYPEEIYALGDDGFIAVEGYYDPSEETSIPTDLDVDWMFEYLEEY